MFQNNAVTDSTSEELGSSSGANANLAFLQLDCRGKQHLHVGTCTRILHVHAHAHV